MRPTTYVCPSRRVATREDARPFLERGRCHVTRKPFPSLATGSTSMASIDPPTDRKRPRSELDPELLVNHPALYFDDGNVTLQCGKTLFRVHRSILLKHSTVFQEMLVPARDTLRDCTLLKAVDDKDDMEAFLNTIYDGLCVDPFAASPLKIPSSIVHSPGLSLLPAPLSALSMLPKSPSRTFRPSPVSSASRTNTASRVSKMTSLRASAPPGPLPWTSISRAHAPSLRGALRNRTPRT